MQPFSSLALIAAHRWKRATFTTFSFSVFFTEAVLIEALTRQGVNEITILTDPLGYRMALRERGAVRIGREYAVHPVVVANGAFHPKLMVLEADDATHVTIGSGNLTFGRWSANLECVDHIHPAGMSLAIGDMGRFFADLARSPACDLAAGNACVDLSGRLLAAAAAGHDDGVVRVATSLEGPLAGRIAEAAFELGGARRLTVASPYWDASAVQALTERLGLETCMAHVPRTRIPAPLGMDWPRGSKPVQPVEVERLVEDGPQRGLHAKVMEVACASGRLVVAGSANATTAGLLAGGASIRNVEVCTVRTEHGTRRRWKLAPAKVPPKPGVHLEDDADADANHGVLVAEHAPDGIRGRVVTPWTADAAEVTIEVARRSVRLGRITVGATGTFLVPLDEFGDELSLEGRVQLQLRSGGMVAEGFVTAPDFGPIRNRAGAALAAMLAVMKDMHTPDDVLAVLEFFRANPDALATKAAFSGSARAGGTGRPDPLVDAGLVGRPGTDAGQPGRRDDRDRGEAAWQRFLDRLLASFARAVPPTEDEGDEGDRAEKVRRRRATEAAGRLGQRFPDVFQKLTRHVAADAELTNLIRLTHFVCATTQHPSTIGFVQRLAKLAEQVPLGDRTRDMLAWCLAYLAADGAILGAATARARMLVLGIDPDRRPDPESALPGFAVVIAPDADAETVLAAIRAVRTMHDDVRALEGLAAGSGPDGLEVLRSHAAWGSLARECAREPEKRRVRFVQRPVTACPKCNISLLHHLKSELALRGICETTCHGFILARNP